MREEILLKHGRVGLRAYLSSRIFFSNAQSSVFDTFCCKRKENFVAKVTIKKERLFFSIVLWLVYKVVGFIL